MLGKYLVSLNTPRQVDAQLEGEGECLPYPIMKIEKSSLILE